MNTLWARFSLALITVLLVATGLPVLILYLLSASHLVEATYVTESQTARIAAETVDRAQLLPLPPPDTEPRAPWPFLDLAAGRRVPYLAYDPETGQWISEVPADLQRVWVTSPVFKFRIDLPAWLALGSLPVISLLIGLGLSVWMSRSVTRPVWQLTEAAQAIGRRDLGYRVAAQGSRELQSLAQAFNRMAAALQRAEITRRHLAADVAHELRTPLAVLTGNVRALLDGVHALSETEIALLYEQTQHLNRLVDDLRVLSLAEADQLSLNRQAVDLARLVKETVAHFDLSAQEQGIELTAELAGALAHPGLDENRLRQVLHNLLANAFRYTGRGGKIVLAARRLASDRVVEITVSDSGAGIPAAALPHIFERCYRAADPAGGEGTGTGLGLAIVKALVEVHGGTVTAHSGGRGQGSTFTIRLPLYVG